MSTLGNLAWILFGGLLVSLGYFIAGLLLCITIIGIPFGYQAFKIGFFAFLPFGRTTVVTRSGSGCLYTLMNILWIMTAGLCLAFSHLAVGLLLCITIVGIPFGLQHFKLMTVALTPFGRDVISA